MIELSMIRDLVAIFGVIAGFSYYVMTVRANQKNQKHQLETRQAQVFRQLYDKMMEHEFRNSFWEMLNTWTWTDFNDFISKYGREENPESWEKFSQVTGLFEQMGLLVRDELISPELVWHWIGPYPIQFWEKFLPIIDEFRLQYEEPYERGMWSEWYEDLVYSLKEEKERDLLDLKVRLARRRKQREAFYQ